jgi:hypothetical protein
MPLGRAQKFALAGLAGVTAFLVGKKAFASPRTTTTTETGCNPAPFTWNEAATRQMIEGEVDDGKTDALEVAKDVADEIYGDYPGGGKVTYPPSSPALAGVECIWSRVTSLVQTIFAEKGVVPGGTKTDPYDIVFPMISDSPTAKDGFFYKVHQGPPDSHGMYSIAKRTLQNANVPDGVQNQLKYLKMIECSPFNDALYNVPNAGGKSGPNHRGIPLTLVHADNYERLLSGQPAKRTAVSTQSGPGGGHYPLIWLPKIKHNSVIPMVVNNPDGTNGINPPKVILDFGLENVSAGNYGCEPWASDAEPLEF